jgi:hypothetical protein
MRWAVLDSPEPTYQTPKCGKMLYEVRFSEVSQPTKHTLRVLQPQIDPRKNWPRKSLVLSLVSPCSGSFHACHMYQML